jgi:hypothetical protein
MPTPARKSLRMGTAHCAVTLGATTRVLLSDVEAGSAERAVSVLLRKIVRVEGLRARCRWEEFRLRLAKARRRPRDLDRGAPRG